MARHPCAVLASVALHCSALCMGVLTCITINTNSERRFCDDSRRGVLVYDLLTMTISILHLLGTMKVVLES